ncbi:ComEC/Rec2 family competence protein [Lutibacter sp.]
MIKFLKFVPVQLTFFLICGILIGNWMNFQPIQLVIIVGFLVVGLTIAYITANKKLEPSLIFTVFVFTIAFFIGVSSITYKNQLNRKQHYSNSPEFTINKPTLVALKIQKILKSNTYYNKYEAVVTQLNTKKTKGKILINIQRDSTRNTLEVDDNLVVKTPFEIIKEPLNPYVFNYKKHLKTQQIYHQIKFNNQQFLLLSNTSSTIKGIAAKVRAKINKSLKKNGFKNQELAVINALLLGQRNSISRDLLESYTGAGAVHILAVSGLHIGIILLLLTYLFKPLHYFKNGKLVATLIIITLLWIYAIIAGLSASVVRAVSMFTALTIGMQLIKRSNVYNTLVISMFFLLLFNPFYLFEIGFQLSYLAVFAIVWIQPKLYNLGKPKFWLPDKIWQLFTVSIAAQIGVLPLSLFYFHQFPGLFFLSNLIIIPFLGFILTVGIIVIIMAVLGILPQFLSYSYSYIIQKMNSFVAWISSQESFIIQNISFSLLLMLACYLCIFNVFKWVEKKSFYRVVWVFVSFILVQSIFIFEKYNLQSTNEFIVFNKSKTSCIGNRIGASLEVHSLDSVSERDYVIKAYLIGSGVRKMQQINSSKYLYKFRQKTILIVDSLGIYNFKTIKPSIVILQQSPKINLERLLKTLQPKLLIADGSNYKSYVARWKQTSIKHKTPFYSTMQKGAYILK